MSGSYDTKKVVIDDGLSTLNGATGIGNYSKLLCESLQSHISKTGCDIEVVYRDYSVLSFVPRKCRRLLYLMLINSTGLATRADIFHFTNYYIPTRKPRRASYVVTIHDLAAWRLPGAFGTGYLGFIRPIVRRAVSFSDRIITVSQTVKNEISDTFGIGDGRISVCYNAVRPIFRPVSGLKKKRYILFVGIIAPQKNLVVLAKAFGRLVRELNYKDLMLVIVGKSWTDSKALESALREESVAEKVVLKGYVGDDEMVRLYNQAQFLVMPSLYEGFGIPIIEAMACGTLVIASDIPVFREVAGDAALFYGPAEDDIMLTEAMDKLLSSISLRQQLISKASEWVRRYSLDNVARDHLQVYNLV